MRIRVGVQAEPKDVSSWIDLARRLDAGPFDSLMLGDHPGSGASPWPALGAAAAVTGTLRLGTYVSQAGVRDPLQVAADAASLDLLAPARVRLGVGAGHTPAEWTVTGVARPSAADRSARLDEFVRIVSGLLAGRTVSLDGKFLTVHDAELEDLGQFAGRVSLTVGGASAAVLATAARHADVVAISGLGKTMPDGHRHEIRWSTDRLEADLARVRAEAQRAGTSPPVEVLVQHVVVTEDRAAALQDFAVRIGGPQPSPAALAETPYLLAGTIEGMAEQIVQQAERWRLGSYVVREGAVPIMERVFDALPLGYRPR